MKHDKDCLYIYFENHKRTGRFARFFGNGVRQDAINIRKIRKSSLQTVNHIGFLFYDNEWKIAELDYFRGGRIIRNITENDIKGFQIYKIVKNTNEIKASLYDLFQDKLQNKHWFYSWRRYDFLECIEYAKNSNIKRDEKETLNLKRLSISLLKKPHNAGWTCIKTTFHILDKHQCNPFTTKLSPYELLIELNEIHTQKQQQTL
jgi:hypothetical protein